MKPECELDSSAGKGVFHGSASSAAWSSKLKPDHFERSARRSVFSSTSNRRPSARLWARKRLMPPARTL